MGLRRLTMMAVRGCRVSKATRLREQIDALQQELSRHQERCKHRWAHRTYKLRGNTGNFDPTQNCYWTEYSCALCLKRWDVDGQLNLVGRELP